MKKELKSWFRKWRQVLGVVLFVKGSVFAFITYKGITGFAVAESPLGISWGFLIGLILMIGGAGIFMAGRKDLGKIVAASPKGEPIIKTRHFERIARAHNQDKIKKAIAKIGTGLGNEEPLKRESARVGKNLHSVRVDYTSRLIYERKKDDEGNKIISLYDLIPDHEYKKIS